MRRRALLSSSGETGRKMIGRYEVVDLGLPSGLLWATCNVGYGFLVTEETEYGSYHMYGRPNEYDVSDRIYQGTEDPLKSTVDTATFSMGWGWRMPTRTEFQELIVNTNYEWATINGINGAKFTSKTNPNAYVFFPAAGWYSNGNLIAENVYCCFWSSTPNGSDPATAYFFRCNNGDKIVTSTARSIGHTVRGVHAAV